MAFASNVHPAPLVAQRPCASSPEPWKKSGSDRAKNSIKVKFNQQCDEYRSQHLVVLKPRTQLNYLGHTYRHSPITLVSDASTTFAKFTLRTS